MAGAKAGKKRFYRGDPYWEKEAPIETKTSKVWLSYYPKAGKLQISQLWQKDGAPQKGKTVTLDAEDIQLHPEAKELLVRILDDWS